MKKSCKIFSAVALSAVLAMGTAMPAFAVNDDGTTGDNLRDDNYTNLNVDGEDYWKQYNKDDLNNGASTNVNIATYSSNYSVTVPLFAPFMLDTAGGEGIAPTNYGIINGGQTAVFVTKIKWDMTKTDDWTFGSTVGDDNNPMDVNKLHGAAVANPETQTKKTGWPEFGSFVITLTNAAKDEVSTLVDPVAGTTSSDKIATSGSKAVKWVLNADDKATTGTGKDESWNPITLSITGSKLFKSLDNLQTNVAAITYTVDSRAPEDPTA